MFSNKKPRGEAANHQLVSKPWEEVSYL